MLDALKKLEYRGGRDGIIYFLCDVISNNEITIQDAEIICSHAPGRRSLSVNDLISYCLTFGWINVEIDVISISSSLAMWNSDKEGLDRKAHV